VAGLVLVVMWLPPVVEQVSGERGNLRAIADYFLQDEGREHHTVTEGYRLMSGQFAWPPQWLAGWGDNNLFSGEPTLLEGAAMPLFLLPLLAASVALWRLRIANSRPLLLTTGLVVLLGVLWVARTLGPVLGYRVAWVSVVGMVAFLPLGWALWVVLDRLFHGAMSKVLVALSLGALAVLGLKNTTSATDPPVTWYSRPWSEQLAATVPDVVGALPDGEGDVILRCDGDAGCIYHAGLFLELEERGLRPRTAEAYGVIASHADHRVHEEGPVRAVLHIRFAEGLGQPTTRDGARLVAYVGEPSPEEALRLARRISRLDELRERGEINEIEYFFERGSLSTRLGQAVGVFLERS